MCILLRSKIQNPKSKIFLALVVIISACNQTSEPDLARRVQAAKPDWQNYVEDLKTELGAGPTAQWQGTPIQALRGENTVEVTFKVNGPWAGRNLAIPVLIREPRGAICASKRWTKTGDRIEYQFQLPQSAINPPWVELKYPTGEMRIVFSENGEWKRG